MSTPFILIAVGLLLACSALFSGLTIGILSLNRFELKRKAQLGNKAAKIVYPIRSNGHQLMVTLLIGNVIVNAGITALLDVIVNGFVAVIFTTILVVTFGEILPMAYLRKHGLEVTAKLAPVLKQLMAIFSPVARPLAKMLDNWLGDEGPSVYSKEELYKILEEHKTSEDSDIEEDEVKIVRHALSFGDKQVREVMTPAKVVTSVSIDDDIGPVFMDELHNAGHSRFPVYNDKKSQNFVGTLYVKDLINVEQGGKVKDFMRRDVIYVHEEESLDHALRAIIKQNHHLMIVVNTFEEFVGVISMEDIIEEILGQEIVDEFDQHADMRAVAKSIAEKEAKKREDTNSKH